MAIKIYPVDIDIVLKPIGVPKCKISLDDQRQDLIVDKEMQIKLFYQGHGKAKLTIEHYGKAESDSTTALIIEEIKFNGISSPKFVYQGIYYPNYPKHLIGNDVVLPHKNYLSWDGVWQLEFALPIYTWIHETLDLGWIYD
jgi:hypothetical protein